MFVSAGGRTGELNGARARAGWGRRVDMARPDGVAGRRWMGLVWRAGRDAGLWVGRRGQARHAREEGLSARLVCLGLVEIAEAPTLMSPDR